MKAPQSNASAACVITFLFTLALASHSAFAQKSEQKGEMPITTTSAEARQLFMQGREKAENLDATAGTLFAAAIAKDPDFALAHLYYAQSGASFAESQKSFAKAASLADKVSPGERAFILHNDARIANNVVKAKEHLDRLLVLHPSDKRAHHLAGNFHRINGDDRLAAQSFRRAVALDKNFAPAYNLLGYAESAMGDYKAAEQSFKTYIKLLPDNPNPYDSYAELLLKTGRYDESIAQYNKALAKDKGFAASLRGIGNNYVFKGDYAKAREFYQRQHDAATTPNGKLNALLFEMLSYLHEGKTDEALKINDRRRALAESSGNMNVVAGTHGIAGFVLAEAGKLDEAAKHFEMRTKTIEASPLPNAQKENLRFNIMFDDAMMMAMRRDYDASQSKLAEMRTKAATRGNPNDEKFINGGFGMLESLRGNHDKALALFAQADSQDPYIWYQTAVAYEKKGDAANAAKWYAKVANWNQNSLDYAVVRPRALAKIETIAKKSK